MDACLAAAFGSGVLVRSPWRQARRGCGFGAARIGADFLALVDFAVAARIA